MAEVNVKELFQSVGLNLNDSQFEAIQSLIGSGGASSLSELEDTNILNPSEGDTLKYNNTTHKWENAAGGSDIDIAKITEDNLQEAIGSTSNIVVKAGLNYESLDPYTQAVEDSNIYLLFYARINGKLIPLPIAFLNDFLKAGLVVVENRDFLKYEGEVWVEPMA